MRGGTYGGQVRQNGDDKQRERVHETHEDEDRPTDGPVARELRSRLVQVRPDDVLRVRRERDRRAPRVLVSQHVRHNVSVRHSSHGREAVVLRLAQVDLVAVALDSLFRPLQLRPAEKTQLLRSGTARE